MQDKPFFTSLKENLNGQPGQPMVLGVCKTLAQRFELEVWFVRLATLVLGAFFTFATLVAYILLGLFMEETGARTKSLFEGLGIWFRELTEKVANLCSPAGRGNARRHDRFDH